MTRRRAAAIASTVLFWALLFSGFILAGVDLVAWHVTGQTFTPIDWMGPPGAWLIAVNTSAVIAVLCALASA